MITTAPSRLTLPDDNEVAAIATAPQAGQPPANIPQAYVKKMNRALERGYGGGFDLSSVGEPEPIEAALLLDHIREILLHWARWPSEHALVMTTVWIAHTWFTDITGRLLFNATPKWLAIASKGSGKSRMLKLLAGLCRDAIGPVSGVVTAPGVRDALDAGQCVILDELHKIVGDNGQRRLDLQGYMLAYTPEDSSLNARRDQGKTCSFAPMAFGAQPVIESGSAFDDFRERSFIVRPQKAERGVFIPHLDDDWERAKETTTQGLALWAAAECIDQKKLWNIHSMSTKLDSRQYEISVPLCAVADRAPDYRYEEGTAGYLRWAIAIREATVGMLLGTDDSTQVMEKIRKGL